MRLLSWSLLVIALASGTAEPASFRGLTVEDLLRLCTDEAPHSAAICRAEIGSLGNVMETVGRYPAADASAHGLCPSDGAAFDVEAARQAFLGWAEAHPEQGQSSLGAGVIMALRDTWSCPSE